MLLLLLQAAVVADQNAKLSVFATRPAIYSPLFNFITETMGTVALILLALLIELQVCLRLVDFRFVRLSAAHVCRLGPLERAVAAAGRRIRRIVVLGLTSSCLCARLQLTPVNCME